MLEVTDLSANYGPTPVLLNVNLQVSNGEIVGILGRNGVGKTTLLKTLMGLVKVREGQIRFKDMDITHLPTHRRSQSGIAYVPQGRLIFPRMTVLDNLLVASTATKSGVSMGELLEEFPVLKTRLNTLGGSLSGGQQQILAVARAMATRPQLLLLDEPTEGLQPSIVDEIGQILRSINQSHITTIMLVEQRLEFAENLSNRAYVMNKGTIIRDLPIHELVKDRELQQELMGI